MPDRYEMLAIDQLRVDLGTHGRVQSDPATVKNYIIAQSEGATRPEGDPVVAFRVGRDYVLASGFHWVGAARARDGGKGKLRVLVKDGSLEDAVAFALTCDTTHGKPLTSEDKRHRVRLALGLSRFQNASTKQIADHCRVSQSLVKDERERSGARTGSESPGTRTGTDNKKYRASRKPAKNGSVAFDWKKFMEFYGGLYRQVDVLGNLYGCKESLEARGLRRLLSEWHKQFKALYNAKSKLKAPEA